MGMPKKGGGVSTKPNGELPLPYWLRIVLGVVQPTLVLLGISVSVILDFREERHRKDSGQKALAVQARKDSLDIVARQQATLASIFNILLHPDPKKRREAVRLAESLFKDSNLAAGFLTAVISLDTDPQIKEDAIRSLGKLESPVSVQAFDRLLLQPGSKSDREKLWSVREQSRKRQNAVYLESLATAEYFLMEKLWAPAVEKFQQAAPLLMAADSVQVNTANAYAEAREFERAALAYQQAAAEIKLSGAYGYGN